MAKIKDIAGGFFNNDTILTPTGFTQAKQVANKIIDRTATEGSNEISQGANLGAESHEDTDYQPIGNIINKTAGERSNITEASPLPTKKDIAAKKKEQKSASKAELEKSRDFAFSQADGLEQEAENLIAEAKQTKDEDERKDMLKQAKALKAEAARARKDAESVYNTNTKKETLVSPDSVASGATAKPSSEVKTTPGTKADPTAVQGRRSGDPEPKPDLPVARPGLYESRKAATETLASKRQERDERVEKYRTDKKNAKRDIREKSIVPDDFDFDDTLDSTDPFVASLFQKVKINKLLKDQIKEQYPDKIAEITEQIKNDPDNADLSGKEVRKLINAAVRDFITPLWKSAGGDTQVNKAGLITPVASALKQIMAGTANESVKNVLESKRDALQKKQVRSLKDQLFLDAWDAIEKNAEAEDEIKGLKGEVKDARSNLTNINEEIRQHEANVDRVLNEFNKGGRKSRTEVKDGWYITHVSGDGANASYASRTEMRDGKKVVVTYSMTAGSPDTDRDPVWISDYQEYSGERDPNIRSVENKAEMRLDQVKGGFEGKKAKIRAAQDEQDFNVLDGQDYFKYRDEHKFTAPKIYKLISDMGGKIDAETGKIYTTSVDQFPEGARELKLGFKEAKKISDTSGKTPEEFKQRQQQSIAKLTGMTTEEVDARDLLGASKDYKLGDANVIKDAQGREIFQLKGEDITGGSGAKGIRFYINWNNPDNRRVVEEYAKQGKDKTQIPVKKLKVVSQSRSGEGNIDWTDKKKTKAAEKQQKAKYTGSYKPSADVLDALIGFSRR